MTRSPFINAFLAILYISVVTAVLYIGSIFKIGHDSVLAPMGLISLFTLSAATMGYLFIYQPFVLYIDGKKKMAVDLFLKTLFTFGGFTVVLFIIMFFSSAIK